MSEATQQNEAMTVLAIQMDQSLRNRIKAAASSEHRTESSFARFYLERAAIAHEQDMIEAKQEGAAQ